MLVGNSCFASADGCKPRPTVSAMRAQQGIAESRCQPGPDFVFTQVVSHRCDQLIENVGMYFVARIVIHSGTIITVRKFRCPFSVGLGALDQVCDGAERSSSRDAVDLQKWRQQFA